MVVQHIAGEGGWAEGFWWWKGGWVRLDSSPPMIASLEGNFWILFLNTDHTCPSNLICEKWYCTVLETKPRVDPKG